MLARAPALLALAIDISTSRKSRINFYWAWVIWMFCASDSWPNKHSTSLAAMLVSNCLIWSGVIRAWKSSSVFSQCHLAQFWRNADDHRLTLSLREINFSIETVIPGCSVKEKEQKWRKLIKQLCVVLGCFRLKVVYVQNSNKCSQTL